MVLAILLVGPVGAGEVLSTADPLADPWLAEQGPAVAEPVEVASERAWAAWTAAGEGNEARVARMLRTRLEYGLGDLVAPASLLAAQVDEEAPDIHAAMAVSLAPGSPAFQMGHAQGLWRAGDVGAATTTFARGLWVTLTSLTAQLWLLESFTFILLVTLLVAGFGFVLLSAIRVWSHAAHDFGDLLGGRVPSFARTAGLAALVLTPLALGEGVIGPVLVLFAIGFLYGDGRQRNALAMAAALLVIALHPLAQLSAISTNLLDRDPVAGSVLRVLSGVENAADVEVLEAAEAGDLAAAHALAYRDRRLGLTESSRDHLLAIVEQQPSDVVALTNLGNIAKRRGDNEGAIEYYERAAVQESDATLLFNLSQAYASAFRMDEYEATLVRAQHLDSEAVAALSALDDATLVADIAYPMGALSSRLAAVVLSHDSMPSVASKLAPGHLGRSWIVTAGAFALVALFSLLFGKVWDHSSLCTRCGHRICTRCEETVWSEEICDDCHHLFQYPESTDPSLRMARLQALSERDARIDKVWLALSLAIPGMAGFAARRPDLAMVALLLFGWALSWLVWPSGPFADPMLMGSVGPLFFYTLGIIATVGYVAVVLLGLIIRKSQ